MFDAVALGPNLLSNRMVMAPMTRARMAENGVPGPMNAEYYRQRASAGLIVTECTQVSPSARGTTYNPGIHTEAQIDGWRKVTNAVHGKGGKVFLQVWHSGRMSHSAMQDGDQPVAPSAIRPDGEFHGPDGKQRYETPRALETEEIPRIVETFGTAAENARKAGFDGVELHGAFGYLPAQFLKSGTNERTDRYGGSVENRARFTLDIVEALSNAWESDRVGIKLSPSNRQSGISDANTEETFGYLLERLDGMGLAYIHMMEPNPGDREIGVQIEEPTRTFRPSAPTTAMIANGGFVKNSAERILADGTADLVSFGKSFIANPDLPARFRQGAPLNRPNPETFYAGGEQGYTDYPALSSLSE
ncbi:alkene reductase [Halococcus sp. IIIV-5B]|nr:alkene reductase [Halococcus sp. IIIV-5B]